MWLRSGTAVFLLVVCLAAQSAGPSASGAAQPQAPLTAEWSALPQLVGNEVKGSIALSNESDDDFDQTVIIEAVNEIGKAFALGYQHFTLRQHSRSGPIRFDTTLPPGHYLIHADAVAEVASKHAIHRVALQGPKPLDVSVL